MDARWSGTDQHPDAADLSRYLVHLTRTERDLTDILLSGRIEARTAHGFAYRDHEWAGGQKSVCLSETPISELGRMRVRGRHYGLVFTKEHLRVRHGAQPVWYINQGGAQHVALRELKNASRSGADPIWKVTPYVDLVATSSSGAGRHDWRWEREWRVNDDIEFEFDEVAAILIPDAGGDFEPIPGVGLGAPYLSPDGGFHWFDAVTEATGAAMTLLVERFHQKWTTPDNALLPRDPEGDWGYVEIVDILDTYDAVYEEFEDFPAEVRAAIVDAVCDISNLWCREGDIDAIVRGAEEEHG